MKTQHAHPPIPRRLPLAGSTGPDAGGGPANAPRRPPAGKTTCALPRLANPRGWPMDDATVAPVLLAAELDESADEPLEPEGPATGFTTMMSSSSSESDRTTVSGCCAGATRARFERRCPEDSSDESFGKSRVRVGGEGPVRSMNSRAAPVAGAARRWTGTAIAADVDGSGGAGAADDRREGMTIEKLARLEPRSGVTEGVRATAVSDIVDLRAGAGARVSLSALVDTPSTCRPTERCATVLWTVLLVPAKSPEPPHARRRRTVLAGGRLAHPGRRRSPDFHHHGSRSSPSQSPARPSAWREDVQRSMYDGGLSTRGAEARRTELTQQREGWYGGQ